MTDPEREHFLQRIGDLERRLRRWRLACFVLLGFLVIPLILGGLLGMAWLPRLEADRERAVERELRVRAALGAELRARQALDEARARAEQEARQRPGEGKD
jgi:hypothetical protein